MMSTGMGYCCLGKTLIMRRPYQLDILGMQKRLPSGALHWQVTAWQTKSAVYFTDGFRNRVGGALLSSIAVKQCAAIVDHNTEIKLAMHSALSFLIAFLAFTTTSLQA